MKKMLTVARTEYLNAVRSKAFLLGLIMLPIFTVGGIVIPQLLRNQVDVRDRRLAVWDRSGKMFPLLQADATARNERQIYEWNKDQRGAQNQPAFRLERWTPAHGQENDAEFILSERVRRKELFGFLIIGKDALNTDGGADAPVSYYTDTPTYTELPEWIESVFNREAQKMRLDSANLDRNLIARLTRHTPLQRLGLATLEVSGGETKVVKAKHENELVTMGIPIISMMLLFMLVMSSAPALLNAVLEEKLQKIAEVLVSSVSPFELMMGKVLGGVLVSLTLSVLYLSAVILALWRYHALGVVPPSHYFWFLFFQLLALLIFGSLFSAIGSACSEIRDAQSMMTPAMLMFILPMFVWLPIIQSPTSAFARTCSLIPPFTPMLMMLRISVPPGPAMWEVALGAVLTTGFMLLCVWASAKIFRIGILSQGQSPSYGRLIRWMLTK